MVRFGFVGDVSSQSIVAEVDLSGAPHAALPSLFPIGLDALRWSVRRLLPVLVLVADSGVPSLALDHGIAGLPPASIAEVVHEL